MRAIPRFRWFLARRRQVACWLLLVAAGLGVAAAGPLSAQPPEPVRPSRLRLQLARSLELDPLRLRLNVPPLDNMRPGDIVTFSPDARLETVARLPRNLYQLRTREVGGEEATDFLPFGGEPNLLRDLVQLPPDQESAGEITVILQDFLAEPLGEAAPQRTAEALRRLDAAAQAQQGGRKLWLVVEVIYARCMFEIFGPPLDAGLTSRLPGFRLTPPAAPDEPWFLASNLPVPVAFLGESLEYTFAEDGSVEAVRREPAVVTPLSEPAWERLRSSLRMHALTDNGHPPMAAPPNLLPEAFEMKKDDRQVEDTRQKDETAEAGNQVTVLYGTCRERRVTPPSWGALVAGFIGRTNGVFAALGLAALSLVIMLVLGFLRRLTLASFVIVAVGAVGLFLIFAAIDSATLLPYLRQPAGVYGNRRGELQYGLATVSIPARHVPGRVESPFSFFVIRLPEDPQEHFTVTELHENEAAFFQRLQQLVAQSRQQDAFLFIHGYNVPFNDAVKRTAQLALDMKFNGAPLCFSWPSQGELIEYLQDSTNTDIAGYALAEFLRRVQESSGAREIHLIAHSMGNDVLTKALRELGKDYLSGESCTLNEIVLAAPDVDAEHFERIATAIKNPRQRITLYASENDEALNKSRQLRGYARAGMAGSSLLIVPGVETIDASTIDTDFLGHSYYGTSAVVDDIAAVFTRHAKPSERGLEEAQFGESVYWRFKRP